MAAILICEPPSPEREQLIALVAGHGHTVTLAPDGEDALVLWRLHRHDLAILDERAAGKGGVELAARIKAESTAGFMPVVLVLERDSDEARTAALAVAEDYALRPLRPVELAARVESHLRTRRIVDGLRAARAESEARILDDPLTGLRNRKFLIERLNEEWKRASRYNEPLSLLLLSIEGLRELERARGAELAERVLCAVANCALASLRQIDLVTRHSATELAALLPNTHFAGSLVCAERLLRAVRGTTVDGAQPQLAIGVAFYPGRELAEPNDLLRIAGRALERARDDGPGAVCLFQHQGYLFRPE